MRTASIRDLRTRFPKVRRLLAEEGEVIVTDRGRPVMLLRPYAVKVRPTKRQVDYYSRLRRRMPKPLTSAQRKALDEASRAER